MKEKQIPIEPRLVTDERGEGWTARNGAPSASRTTRTIAAEYERTPRGKASRLVALVQARLEPDNLAEQMDTYAKARGRDADEMRALTEQLPRVLQVQALGALLTSDHPEASKMADRRESARVRALTDYAEAIPAQAEKVDAALVDLWAATLHTDAEAAVWRNLGKYAPHIREVIRPHRAWIRRATVGSRADNTASVQVKWDDETQRMNANIFNAAQIAETLAAIAKHAQDSGRVKREAAQDPTKPGEPTKKKPGTNKPQTGGKLWRDYNTYTLTERATHPNGQLGRKWASAPYGKSVGPISREITDPAARIFRRRTSGRGGTVVVDCSGSMALQPAQLEAILKAAGGATVYAYTSDYDAPQGVCGIWELARNGKRVREIPTSCAHGGDNGIDGEALRHALKTHRKSDPFIWITDGGVTGRGQLADMVNDCRATMRQARGYYAHDHEQAVRLLHAIARGARPRTAEPPYFAGTTA